MESHEFVIDRIEGESAVVEWSDSMFSNIPTSVFPNQPPPREGDVYTLRLLANKTGLKTLSDDPIILSDGSSFSSVPYGITPPSHFQLYSTIYPEDLTNDCSLFNFPKHGHPTITKSFPVGPFKFYESRE
jgi:hypothetical protein